MTSVQPKTPRIHNTDEQFYEYWELEVVLRSFQYLVWVCASMCQSHVNMCGCARVYF